MPDLNEQTNGRRAEQVRPKVKIPKRNAPRKYQSMWNMSQLPDEPSSPLLVDALPNATTGTNNMVTLINVNFNRRLPKWLRWGAAKRSGTEMKTDRFSKIDSALSDSVGADRGFIGNLGLGGYIEKDDSAFVPSDELYESGPAKRMAKTTHTKSLINLSTVLLWPADDATDALSSNPHKIRDPSVPNSDRDSISMSSINSSVGDSPHSSRSANWNNERRAGLRSDPQNDAHSDKCPVIPNLIRVLFLTNTPLGRQLNDMETLRHPMSDVNRKPLDPVKVLIQMPAWFVHENSPIVSNMTYSLYRTSDYRDQLQRSIRWLEDRLHVRSNFRQVSRNRSPSAPRYAVDHRARRVPFADPAGLRPAHIRPPRSPSRVERSPDPNGEEQSEGRSSPSLLPARTELESMLRVLSEACRFMDIIQSPSDSKGDEPPSENSAIVLRNTGINTSFPSAHQLVLPQMENFPICKNQSNTDLRKIFLEDFGLIYKISMNSSEPVFWEEVKSMQSTLMLGSNLLLMSDEPIPQKDHVTSVRFKHVLPLSQIWCHVIDHPLPSGVVYLGDVDKNATNIWNYSLDSTSKITKEMKTTYDALARKTSPSLSETDGRTVPGDKNNSASRFILVGCPPANNWLVRFPDRSVGDKWIATLQELIDFNQQILAGRSLCVKILNELTDNQVIYKYHNVKINHTVKELKEKALGSMNIKGHTDCHMLVRYHPTVDEERDIPLTGFESPFIIALSLTLKICGDFSNTDDANHSVPSSPGKSMKAAETKSGKLFDFLKKHEDELRESQAGPTTDFETFLRHLPSSDPIISRDQLKVEFVLHSKAGSSGKPGKKGRSGGVIKPSDLKKSSPNTGNATRVQKSRSKMNEKTKSTLFLDKISPLTSQTTIPLRGARSLGSLNTAARVGEIFGQAPEELWPEPSLPHSLMSLFVIVYYSGVNVEGIFRRTAVASHIEAMREKVDENVEIITPSMCPPILAACVLKRFFHEIPGHVLGDENWGSWAEVLKLPTIDERVEPIQRLIRKLPKANQSLLLLLIYLLTHIRDHEASNRMSTTALATVWGPNLIQKPRAAPTPEDSKVMCQIAECLLNPKLTNSVLLESPGMKEELNRLFVNKWNSLIDSNMSVDDDDDTLPSATQHTLQSHDDSYSTHSDLGRSTVASAQESFTEHAEPLEEHSLSSSIPFSRSELSSLDDAPNRKHLHSHSSLLSTTTSSSAESQNASPVLTANRIYYSPMLTDKRRANCLPRRKLLIRTEQTLPDPVAPPSSSSQMGQSVTDSDSHDSSPNRLIDNQRMKRQISLPFDDKTYGRASPPPVPPRASSNVIQMPEIKLSGQGNNLSPPVPPKPKPRQRMVEIIPRRKTVTTEAHWDVNSAITERMHSSSVPSKSAQRPAFRVTYSRVSNATNSSGSGSEKRLSSGERSENSQRKLSATSSDNQKDDRVRDRRHSFVDNNRVIMQQERHLPIQNSPKISNMLPPITPSIPVSSSRAYKPIFGARRDDRSDASVVDDSQLQNVHTDPCQRKHLPVTMSSTGNNVRRYEQTLKPSIPSQSACYEWIRAQPLDSIRPTRTTVVQMPTARSRRPQSIDRINIAESRTKAPQPVDSAKLLSAHIAGVPVKRSDSATENDPRPFAQCVRRMSSHASTISSGSNTLVSTSNEQIN